MKLSNIKIENDQIVLKFDYRMYGIGDDITMMHDLKLWSDPKQVCEDLVNTANGIIDTLELDMEIKSVLMVYGVGKTEELKVAFQLFMVSQKCKLLQQHIVEIHAGGCAQMNVLVEIMEQRLLRNGPMQIKLEHELLLCNHLINGLAVIRHRVKI